MLLWWRDVGAHHHWSCGLGSRDGRRPAGPLLPAPQPVLLLSRLPSAQPCRRFLQRDAQALGAPPVPVAQYRLGFGFRHRGVDRALALDHQLRPVIVAHHLVACRQYELELRCVLYVDAREPVLGRCSCVTLQGFDHDGLPVADHVAVEVDDGQVDSVRHRAPEHPDLHPVGGFLVHRALQEVFPRQTLVVHDDRNRVVPAQLADLVPQAVEVSLLLEGHSCAAGQRAVRGTAPGHAGFGFTGEVLRLQGDSPPASAVARPGLDLGVASGQGEESHPGWILGSRALVGPSAAAELEQLAGLRDADAVVADRYRLRLGRDLHLRGAGAARVLQHLSDDRFGGRVEEPGHLLHCEPVDARP